MIENCDVPDSLVNLENRFGDIFDAQQSLPMDTGTSVDIWASAGIWDSNVNLISWRSW